MHTHEDIIITMAEIYGQQMSETRLKGYLSVLGELTVKELTNAYNQIIKDHSYSYIPLPAQIYKIARPQLTPKEMAVASATRIKLAIKKFGWPGPDEARNFLNDTEWNFIKSRGGWMAFCENPENNIHDSTIYAQSRDSLLTAYSAQEKGITPDLVLKENLTQPRRLNDVMSKTLDRKLTVVDNPKDQE